MSYFDDLRSVQLNAVRLIEKTLNVKVTELSLGNFQIVNKTNISKAELIQLAKTLLATRKITSQIPELFYKDAVFLEYEEMYFSITKKGSINFS